MERETFQCPFTFSFQSTDDFDIFVEKGERIKIEETIQTIYFPNETDQASIKIPVYRSRERCHNFSRNCEKIAYVSVDVPNSIAGQEIKVKVTFQFKRHGMRITAVSEDINRTKTAFIRYHRNSIKKFRKINK
ncbi:hypothetical protein CHS0354_021327 [Potamilus streckersoni]|uniref:Uncharacterized protein n=1 Tax=Potamilus streckersoni TaxID=2493646 RepID=A0AAE0TKA0_9BIVA|nr:hypothetical protein CHS0354_021327 [Potamilus streckersoni]